MTKSSDLRSSQLVTFEEEMALPETNVYLYRRVYLLEQWLRRIALAALMARHGSRWHAAMPGTIADTIKPRLASLRNRVAFDVENSDNVIWILTLAELESLMLYDKVWPVVK